MSSVRYVLGKARRFVAGNVWCAQKKNSGRLPCLECRGRGTVGESMPRRYCDKCNGSGYGTYQDFDFWYEAGLMILRKIKDQMDG